MGSICGGADRGYASELYARLAEQSADYFEGCESKG